MQLIKLIAGIIMLAFCLVLLCLFLFPFFHYQWWSGNAYFLAMTVIAVFCALMGGYFVRAHLFRGPKKDSLGFEILTMLGYTLALGGILLGAGALMIALDVSVNTGVGTETLTEGMMIPGMAPGVIIDHDYHYPEDFLVMDSQVLLLSFSMLISILGQFFIGFSRKRKSEYI